MFLKIISTVIIALHISAPSLFASAFDEAIGRINQIKDEGKKITDQELLDILIPIAKSPDMPEESKRDELNSILKSSYVLFGRDSSKEKIQVGDLLKDAQRRRRLDYIKAHPDLGPRTKEAIQKGKVLVGMTAEQAQASWGVPDKRHTVVNSTHSKERWSYFGRVFLSFEGDKVVRMESIE